MNTNFENNRESAINAGVKELALHFGLSFNQLTIKTEDVNLSNELGKFKGVKVIATNNEDVTRFTVVGIKY